MNVPSANPHDHAKNLADRFGPTHEVFTAIVHIALLVTKADGVIDPAELDALVALVEQMAGSTLSRGVVRMTLGATLADIKQSGVDKVAQAAGELLLKHDAVAEGLSLGVSFARKSESLSGSELEVLGKIAAGANAQALLADLLEAT